jgi:hypothetical protein
MKALERPNPAPEREEMKPQTREFLKQLLSFPIEFILFLIGEREKIVDKIQERRGKRRTK